MKKLLVAVAMIAAASVTVAHAGSQRSPSQACQAQALASIARKMPNAMTGQFQIIVKADGSCRVFLQVPSLVAENKRAAWMIEGKTGEILAEFYAPIGAGGVWQDNDVGLCTLFGGKFKTGDCTWSEYIDKADQM